MRTNHVSGHRGDGLSGSSWGGRGWRSVSLWRAVQGGAALPSPGWALRKAASRACQSRCQRPVADTKTGPQSRPALLPTSSPCPVPRVASAMVNRLPQMKTNFFLQICLAYLKMESPANPNLTLISE